MPGAATADHFRLLKMTWRSGFCIIMDCNEWNRKLLYCILSLSPMNCFTMNCMYFVSSCIFLVYDLSSPVRDKESELLVMRERNRGES